ncbi:hypothetical protein VVD49_07365 [Uliginosibacterium sp. H3]|uniref:RNA-binding protein n=1 Tax=Uliginosibacterium silvisoli TaxID=3114758 RepID=A0ABU6K271_9RHOO|nr:hypothetical protein [Uliginosibacterium sp. H3]
MTRLLLSNIAPGTSEEDVAEFLTKYGFPAFDTLEHVTGDDSRPSVILTFGDASINTLTNLQPRIHGLYWKERTLSAQVMHDSFG